MNLQTKKLTKLSICDCGYAVLHDSIRLDTEYIVDLDSVRGGFVYGCGGCGKVQTNVRIVRAEVKTRFDKDFQPLPAGLFDL